MTVTWLPSVSPEVRAIFEPDVQKLLWLLPTWVQEFVVLLDGSDDAGMSSTVEEKYRRFTIRFTGHSLSGTEDKRQMLCHEFAHAYTTTPWQGMSEIIDEVLGKDAPAAKVADRAGRDAMEGATTDLGNLLFKIVYQGERG